MEQETTIKNKSKNNVFLVIVILILVVLIAGILYTSRTIEIYKYYSFDLVPEWTTLECYYRNVAEKEESATGLLDIGYKKYWLEYITVVKMGIEDTNQIEIHKPNIFGKVKIYIPEVKVLDVSDQPQSMKLIKDTGLFTTITTEEQSKVYNSEVKKLEDKVNSDKELLNYAYEDIKNRLEAYVISIGKQFGKEYKVEWLDKPLNTK